MATTENSISFDPGASLAWFASAVGLNGDSNGAIDRDDSAELGETHRLSKEDIGQPALNGSDSDHPMDHAVAWIANAIGYTDAFESDGKREIPSNEGRGNEEVQNTTACRSASPSRQSLMRSSLSKAVENGDGCRSKSDSKRTPGNESRRSGDGSGSKNDSKRTSDGTTRRILYEEEKRTKGKVEEQSHNKEGSAIRSTSSRRSSLSTNRSASPSGRRGRRSSLAERRDSLARTAHSRSKSKSRRNSGHSRSKSRDVRSGSRDGKRSSRSKSRDGERSSRSKSRDEKSSSRSGSQSKREDRRRSSTGKIDYEDAKRSRRPGSPSKRESRRRSSTGRLDDEDALKPSSSHDKRDNAMEGSGGSLVKDKEVAPTAMAREGSCAERRKSALKGLLSKCQQITRSTSEPTACMLYANTDIDDDTVAAMDYMAESDETGGKRERDNSGESGSRRKDNADKAKRKCCKGEESCPEITFCRNSKTCKKTSEQSSAHDGGQEEDISNKGKGKAARRSSRSKSSGNSSTTATKGMPRRINSTGSAAGKATKSLQPRSTSGGNKEAAHSTPNRSKSSRVVLESNGDHSCPTIMYQRNRPCDESAQHAKGAPGRSTSTVRAPANPRNGIPHRSKSGGKPQPTRSIPRQSKSSGSNPGLEPSNESCPTITFKRNKPSDESSQRAKGAPGRSTSTARVAAKPRKGIPHRSKSGGKPQPTKSIPRRSKSSGSTPGVEPSNKSCTPITFKRNKPCNGPAQGLKGAPRRNSSNTSKAKKGLPPRSTSGGKPQATRSIPRRSKSGGSVTARPELDPSNNQCPTITFKRNNPCKRPATSGRPRRPSKSAFALPGSEGEAKSMRLKESRSFRLGRRSSLSMLCKADNNAGGSARPEIARSLSIDSFVAPRQGSNITTPDKAKTTCNELSIQDLQPSQSVNVAGPAQRFRLRRSISADSLVVDPNQVPKQTSAPRRRSSLLQGTGGPSSSLQTSSGHNSSNRAATRAMQRATSGLRRANSGRMASSDHVRGNAINQAMHRSSSAVQFRAPQEDIGSNQAMHRSSSALPFSETSDESLKKSSSHGRVNLVTAKERPVLTRPNVSQRRLSSGVLDSATIKRNLKLAEGVKQAEAALKEAKAGQKQPSSFSALATLPSAMLVGFPSQSKPDKKAGKGAKQGLGKGGKNKGASKQSKKQFSHSLLTDTGSVNAHETSQLEDSNLLRDFNESIMLGGGDLPSSSSSSKQIYGHKSMVMSRNSSHGSLKKDGSMHKSLSAFLSNHSSKAGSLHDLDSDHESNDSDGIDDDDDEFAT